MRILYGLSGDGLGHTMRARVVAEHLRQAGHVVHMAANGDYAIARAAISAKTPKCDHYLVSSFFFPEERANNRTPTTHQPEQELNARWLEALDLGVHAKRATAFSIRRFLNRSRPFQSGDARIKSGTRDGLEALDRILKEVA